MVLAAMMSVVRVGANIVLLPDCALARRCLGATWINRPTYTGCLASYNRVASHTDLQLAQTNEPSFQHANCELHLEATACLVSIELADSTAYKHPMIDLVPASHAAKRIDVHKPLLVASQTRADAESPYVFCLCAVCGAHDLRLRRQVCHWMSLWLNHSMHWVRAQACIGVHRATWHANF